MRLGAGFNKLVSFAIVWCMVISSFLGVMLIAVPEVGVSAQGEIPNGDMIIGTGYSKNLTVLNQGSYPFDGNLTIRAGGLVDIENSTLVFRSSYSGNAPTGNGVKALTLTVEDGGILILDNSTLTVDLVGGNLIPALGVVVRHGGYLESRTSNISFSGHILVDDAKFSLIDSTVSGLTTSYNSSYFPTLAFRSSPVMLFMSSDVTMIGSRVLDMYDNGTYNSNTATIAPYSNNYKFASDTRSRTYVDYYLERDVNAAFGAGTTVSGSQKQLSMTMNDTKNVTVAPNQKLYTTGFDMGGLVFEPADVSSIILHVSYKTSTSMPIAGTNDPFYYTQQFGSTNITTLTTDPTYLASSPSGTNVNTTMDFTLPRMSAQSLSRVVLNYTNSRSGSVYIDRIWVTIDMRLSTYRNITLGGSTNFVAADSYIPLNIINENNGLNAAKGAYHKLVALDQSVANLYGLTVYNSTGGYSGTNVFKTKNHAVILRPDIKGSSDNTVGNSLSQLQAIDGSYYTVGAGSTMQISHLNAGDLNGVTANASIEMRYRTSGGYANGGYITYSFDGVTYKNTNILIVDRSTGDITVTFSVPGKHTLVDLSNLRIQYVNPSAGTVLVDALWLDIRSEPTVALYRWSSLEVTDSQSVPVRNVGVTSTNLGTGATAYYLGQSGAATTPPQAILAYLGKTASNYNRTAADGTVKIPLLSDVLNSSNLRNGKAFDYNLAFSFRNANGLYVLDDSNGGITSNFAHFPNLSQNVDVRTVVFPTLAIAYGTTTYSGTTVTPISGSGIVQVKGDILIKDNAKLIITNGTLKIFNDYPNQFKIVVSGNGSIVMDAGTITSTNSMQILLTDNAVLSARNGSVLPGLIRVVIDGHSKVVLSDDSFMAASFTAPLSSFGNLTATNVTFLSNIANFGGKATAVLTSVSISSIVLQDEARAWSYRWLTVAVMDGTLVHGIPNAYVEVDRSAGAKYATAKTGADGTATIKLLSDTINSYGAPHFDYYRVNATYWFKGHAYQSSGDIFGVYTQVVPDPMMSNGTQIAKSDIVTSVNVLGALPELDPPFWASTYTPARGVNVNLTANITNTGVVTAYNVLVRFKDLTTDSIIADRTIQSIAPGAYSNITVPWAASYPVGVHTLNVTVDPFLAIPQLNRANNWNQTTISVEGVSDLSIFTSQIVVNPASPVTNSTVSVRADITNSGDNMDQSVVISFYDTFLGVKVLIGNFTLPAIRSGQTGVALATWQHMLPGDHNITVVIDEKNLLLESSRDNNRASLLVKVLDYPDLAATSLQFKLSGSLVTQVFIGDSVDLTATVMNTGESVASDFMVRFWLGSTSTGTKIGDVVVPNIASGATAEIQLPWIASTLQGSGHNQSRLITIEVNPFTHGNDTPITETNLKNNVVSSSILVIDNRADLMFLGGVSVKPHGQGNATTDAVQGQTIDISFTVANEGLKPADGVMVDIYVKTDNSTEYLTSLTKDLAGGASTDISFPWVVNITSGVYSLVVEMNSRHSIDESNYTNDIDSRVFTINAPNPHIVISVGSKTDFQPGDSILVTGMITNVDGSYPLANQSITIRLLDSAGLPVGQAMATKTDSTGAYSGYLFVPTDRSGSHSVSVTLNSGATYSAAIPINIVEIFKPQSVPFWIFILIAVIVLAIILIFSVYLYKHGLSKMVECGECGALIPESSKRCPRCGTEFETETAKCSECGTWIPARSKECPECGAKFMTEPMEEVSEDDYLSSMRRQYEEYVNGFREQAKAALGKKYSEDKFMDWLKTEPAYLTFEAWVAKQEEGRKASSMPCPACGTLNPKGAAICSKCGTVFDKAPEVPQAGEAVDQAKPFRKIVKRSSERKMVPKKVVKEDLDQTGPSEPAKEEKK